MQTTWGAIAEQVLGKISESAGYEGTDTETDLATIAASFPFVLDLLNQEGIPVRNPLGIQVTVPAGRDRFTWGPGGDIDGEPPREIEGWYQIRDGASYYGGEMLAYYEWQSFLSSPSTGSEPIGLYWDRTPEQETGRTTIHVWPTLDAPATLLLYADAPSFAFDLTRAVFFAPGEAMLFVLRAWEYNADSFGAALPADFRGRVRRAEDAITAAIPPPEIAGNTRFTYGMGAISRRYGYRR